MHGRLVMTFQRVEGRSRDLWRQRAADFSDPRSYKRKSRLRPPLMTSKYGVWLLLSLFIIGLWPAMTAETFAAGSEKVELYTVVAGIKTYKDPAIPKLTISDKDAKDFIAFLNEAKPRFAKTHITFLLNEQVTRENLTRAFRQDLKPASKNDIVIIYLSGHGAADPTHPNEFYFITYDTKFSNLFGTALLMSDPHLLKGIDSDRILFLSDACHSGGFNPSIEKSISKEASNFFSLFENLKGRIALASSRPDEKSYEKPKFGNSIFTHYVLKGLRGDAARGCKDGVITANALYDYVYKKTRQETDGLQNPQLYCAKGQANDTPVFVVPTFDEPLKIKVQFFYEDDTKRVSALNDESVLKSGQHVGMAFRAESDCYAYVFWWDSSGAVGRLFPNPGLSEGSGEVKAGKTYWIPSMQGERWYVLDRNPGHETIYFVASRSRNPKVESLFEKVKSMEKGKAKDVVENEPRPESRALERELNLMGFADYTEAKSAGTASSDNSRDLLKGWRTRSK